MEKDWKLFGMSYLYLAECGCIEILQGKKENSCGFVDDIQEEYKIKYLVFPIIYNIKHSLEVVIKHLYLFFYEYDKIENEIKTHNINKLFGKLKDSIKKNMKKIENIEDSLVKSLLKKYGGIDHYINKIEKIIYRYYCLDILKDKIENNFNIIDEDNTALKYPENNLRIKLEYSEISNKFKRNDIENIKNDIGDIIYLMSVLHIIFGKK